MGITCGGSVSGGFESGSMNAVWMGSNNMMISWIYYLAYFLVTVSFNNTYIYENVKKRKFVYNLVLKAKCMRGLKSQFRTN